ncbi:MAG: LytTR family DNA-binding domain-containing protein [Bacteroidota bacterium]
MDSVPLKCLIIEDEPLAAEVLTDYIGQVAFLELQGHCSDAIFALEQLHQTPIDVIFLDIHLPKLKGLDFLRSLQQRPQTILTTAYHEYALDGFEEGVVDYLMKPIAFSLFLKAVNKLERATTPAVKVLDQLSPPSAERPFRFFNVNKNMVRVYYDEIQVVESLKDYSQIVTGEEKIVTRGQIGEMEALLEGQGFMRIHRSYIVNLDHIKAFSANDITVAGRQFPIGRSYKAAVANALAAYFKQS